MTRLSSRLSYNRIVINGEFCARRLTGQERVARELVLELDKLIEDGFPISLVIPEYAQDVPQLNRIPVVRTGNAKGSFWEQLCLGPYAIKTGAYCLNICSIAPLISDGAIFIHDICYKEHPEYFKSIYSRVSQAWHKIHFQYAWHRADRVYTVSEYSKSRMVEVYGIDPSLVTVVYPGWRYFEKVAADAGIAERNPTVAEGGFYYSLGSLAPNKNLNWILDAARHNQESTFVVAGGFNATAYGSLLEDGVPQNVLFVGYVSDGESKYLMQRCKAFILPSEYEGFGIPPLEALSVGAEVVVSNVTCLPEIYEDAVHYIDPKNPAIDLDALLSEPLNSPKAVLAKCDYAKMAGIVYNDLIMKVGAR